MIQKHLNKDNLHHAYLLEGLSTEIIPEILKFLKTLGVKTIGNPDFMEMNFDSFKMEDARNLKSFISEKSFSGGKRVFVIVANDFLLEAQNSLLKIFEEPIENTHFFLIVPDVNSLLKTLVSRFYVITDTCVRQDLTQSKEVEKFISMPLKSRLEFIKELLAEAEEEPHPDPLLKGEGGIESSRSKALKFLNALESRLSKTVFDTHSFEHFFKVREFLRMPGSSAKMLLESVALVVPNMLQ